MDEGDFLACGSHFREGQLLDCHLDRVLQLLWDRSEPFTMYAVFAHAPLNALQSGLVHGRGRHISRPYGHHNI